MRASPEVPSTPINGSERALLIETLIPRDAPPSSILEVGFGYGQNLSILTGILLDTKIVGLEKDRERIDATHDFFEVELSSENRKHLTLLAGDATSLPFSDSSFELVLCSAVLLYLDNEQAKKALMELCRVAAKKVVLLEQHCPGVEERHEPNNQYTAFPYYVRDYHKLLCSDFISNTGSIEFKSIPSPRWRSERWVEYGVIIEVVKESD